VFFVFAVELERMLVVLGAMTGSVFPLFSYFIPFFTLITRGAVFLKNCDAKMRNEPLTKAEMAREPTRAFVLALAGFSFTGLMGISVLDNISRHNFTVQVFYLLVSFLCYLNALQLQDYKFLLLREIISDTLIDIATLCLICSAVSLVIAADYGKGFKAVILCIALLGWAIDHSIRIRYIWQDYNAIRKGIEDGTRRKKPSGGCCC
jgi:hypothetical protein